MEKTKDVPPELVSEILARLPVKSLMRFKSVCKPWSILIEHPDFVVQHFGKSTTCLLTKYQLDSGKLMFSLLSNDTLDVVAPNIDLHYPGIDLERLRSKVRAYRPVNGIMCVQFSGKDILLWNPATTEVKILPESYVRLPAERIAFSQSLGFGYDSGTNDFKVVRIMWLGYDEDYNRSYDPIVATEVYDLKSDAWRKLDAVVPTELQHSLEISQLSVDGMFAWASLPDEYDGQEKLILFHMSDERFTTIVLPGIYLFEDVLERPKRGFCTLNGSIVLIDHFYLRTPSSYKIWVLNCMGIEETWSKLYSFEAVPGLRWPLGFHKNGELFLESSSGELVSFDPVNHTVKHLGIQGRPFSLYIFEYKESLVKLH